MTYYFITILSIIFLCSCSNNFNNKSASKIKNFVSDTSDSTSKSNDSSFEIKDSIADEPDSTSKDIKKNDQNANSLNNDNYTDTSSPNNNNNSATNNTSTYYSNNDESAFNQNSDTASQTTPTTPTENIKMINCRLFFYNASTNSYAYIDKDLEIKDQEVLRALTEGIKSYRPDWIN